MGQLNVVERAIYTISPSWALQRRRSAALIEAMEMARNYQGASYGPLTEDWVSTYLSSRSEISQDVVTLRNRMRDLVRNDGYAFAAVEALANNIIGKGIRPYFPGQKGASKKVERGFLDWCDSTDSDFVGGLNFYGNQQLILKSAVESGQCLVVKRYVGKGKKMKLSLQVLEADFLVHWFTVANLDKTKFPFASYALNGIYYDEKDTVVGYEIYSQHPGDSLKVRGYEHSFVPADDCLLIYKATRPGQTQGVPVGAPVMLEHKMLAQYELAQAHRQTISAMFAVFITSLNSEMIGAQGNTKSKGANAIVAGERLSPGTIQYLQPGEDVKLAEPPSVDGFDEYCKTRLRKMARGWGLSYEVISGDLSNVNFSSGRMGWIEMHRNIESWQSLILIPKLCNRVWQWWFDLEQLKGTVPFNAEVRVDWTAPRREMLDPVKETKAIIEQIQAGLKSHPSAIRELGNDPEIEMMLIEEWNKLLDKHGLVFSSDYRNIQEAAMKGSDNKPAPQK